MKRLVFMFLFLAFVLEIKGQTGPVFPYNNPSKETIKALAKENSVKGSVFRTYLVQTINLGLVDTTLKVSTANIDYTFDRLFYEEIYLEEGGYKNSGYNPTLKKMVSSTGHKWSGFGWVFRVGTFKITLLKGDCANILTVPVVRLEVKKVPPKTQDSPEVLSKWTFIPLAEQKEEPISKSTVVSKDNAASPGKKKIKAWVPILGAAILGTAAYLIFKKGKTAQIIEPPIIDPRTMPPGLPSGPGGIPSDPRSQPPGGG
ncbi:hypothetical protein K8Q96_01470 [Candidatus Nomurabacteria bacterium]|nr:hypothetical protein [Candidatus Nomurabacteria bacterium]